MGRLCELHTRLPRERAPISASPIMAAAMRSNEQEDQLRASLDPNLLPRLALASHSYDQTSPEEEFSWMCHAYESFATSEPPDHDGGSS